MFTLLQVIFVTIFLQSVTSSQQDVGTKISNYENYLENFSEIGKEITCTGEQKDCFKFNRVLYTDGKCYMISHIGPCDNQEFHFNKEKAENGQYVPECMPSFRCGDPSLRYMSYDQTCYQASLINEVCDFRNNLSYSNDIYGGGHCRCFGDSCPPRPIVTQPDEAGRCRLPDLIHIMFPYWNNPIFERHVPCSSEELECFKEGKVLHVDGTCYSLMEQGPCPDGHLFTANKTAFDELGWLVSTCSPATCDQESENTGRKVRMQNDGKCYLLDDVKNKLCPPHIIVFDVFGEVSCGFSDQVDFSKQLPTSVMQNGNCVRSRIRF